MMLLQVVEQELEGIKILAEWWQELDVHSPLSGSFGNLLFVMLLTWIL